MNAQAVRNLFLNLVSKGTCPSCRRQNGFTATLTLDGGRLYTCGCGFKLLVPKELVKEVEKCPEE